MHTVGTAYAQQIVTALEAHQPLKATFSFGYNLPDVVTEEKEPLLVVPDAATISLAGQQLIFSNLKRWKASSIRQILLILAYIMLLYFFQHTLFTSYLSIAISVVIFCLLDYCIALYLQRWCHPFSISYQHIVSVIPQGHILFLKIQDAAGRIKSILFRLTDLAQIPMLQTEMDRHIRSQDPDHP